MITQTRIGLRWNASTDNVGAAGHRMHRNGTRVTTTAPSARSHTVTGLSSGTVNLVGGS